MRDKNETHNPGDLVMKDGRLIGDFEGLYKNCDDPWGQSELAESLDTSRLLALAYCKKICENELRQPNRLVELGCSHGYMTNHLTQKNFSAFGIDVTETAIWQARSKHPDSTFSVGDIENFKAIAELNPDIFIMAEITWYVLEKLDSFLKELRRYAEEKGEPVYLIHLLTTYKKGIQKYGIEKFTNRHEIDQYFNLTYLESGFIEVEGGSRQGTYFVAKVTG